MTGPKQNTIKIKEIGILCQSHCKIRDTEKVEKIINELIAGGINKLQVVSDFDRTITKDKTEDGKPVLTSFGMFTACKSLPAQFIEEADKLYKKYRPIEIDPNMPMEEKIQHMVDWWSKSSDLLVGIPFEQKELDDIAYQYCHALRDGTLELFSDLNKLDVPVLVFSAGLGNSVMSVLKYADILYPNVKIISNYLQYKDGLLNGLQEDIIHIFNKNECALKGTEYYDMILEKDHVIVMGDSIGDAGMADGVPRSSNVLKIGFLFDNDEQSLTQYLEHFDIVLIDDQTMNVPRAILSLIK